jgi:hypothetical protein
MRVYRARGERSKAAFHEAEYRRYKEDETARALAADYRRDNSWDNRESLPIHVHAEAQPPTAAAPSWISTIGPKGYQTDMGYLTRTHPPIIREARDAARPPKPAAAQPPKPYSAP